MDDLLRRFLTKIGIADLKPFEEGSFLDCHCEKESNRVIGKIRFPHYLDYSAYTLFFDTVSSFTARGGFGIVISFDYPDEDLYFPRLLEEIKEAKGFTRLDDLYLSPEEKKAVFFYTSAAGASEIDEETRWLRNFLDSITSSYHILTQEKVDYNDDFEKKRSENYKKTVFNEEARRERNKEINRNYQPCKLKDITNFRKVICSGTIFKIEDRQTRKRTTIRRIEFSDGSDSIAANLFEGKRRSKEELLKYDVGVKIEVKGQPTYDKFARNELIVSIDQIKVVPPDEQRKDTYPRKRIELHLHTRRSAFDGVASIGDYAKAAKDWGWKAIAVTDHGVVQAFPEAQKAAKKTGLKILYGSELFRLEDHFNYIYNPSDRLLKQESFVVFDTETTGLSCRYGRLIEFGAVKRDQAGQILDQIDFFINPDRKLSSFSINVSHITQEQVDHGKPIKQALNDIKEFFGDSIIVAHNAAFDFDFINEALKNNGREKLKNPVIDTLPLSRYLYPDRRSHREEALARRLQIDFDSTGAHRANYDAAHLATIFSSRLSELNIRNPEVKRHKDLANLPVTKERLLTSHPYHCTVYAKNRDGLKDLYRVISESSTIYIGKDQTPYTPKSYLAKYRQNLIIGSGCLNGEVWEAARNKSKEDLAKKMEFYDFIEVQPPENYIYQIHKGEIGSMDEVKKIIKDVIQTGKENGKIVCATGDCHYLNPQDKIYRDVFISAKGLKGARHPLCLQPYDNASEEVKQKWYHNPLPNPSQHLRTTDERMECFSFLDDTALEEEIIIDNPEKISDRISGDIKPTKDKLYPPSRPGCEQRLIDLTYKTAKERYGDPLPKLIEDRLKIELDGIVSNGYSVIYWLSSLIVRWSNTQGYLIGSRGSVGSSLVATRSGITEVNPLPPHYRCPHCHHLEWIEDQSIDSGFDLPAKKCPECGEDRIRDGQNIPFATFLGFHAEKVPDIDLNFPSDFQSIAHEHRKERLNQTGNRCFKAGTIQTAQEKNARGYVLGYFESLGKDTSKIRNAEIDHIANGCVGTKRSTGQHPGGVIVIPAGREAYDFTPVQYPADDPNSTWMTTHYDFHAIHDNVLKFDRLGHVDPQAIKRQCDFCGFSFRQLKEKVPISDPEAQSLFWSADALHLKKNVLQQQTGALGLPEFGTENGRRVLIETKPHSFADLVRISGLSHGTNVFAGNAEDLITEQNFALKDCICCRDDIRNKLHDKWGVEYTDAFAIMEFTRKGFYGKPGNEEKKEKFDKIRKEHNVPEWYIESCHKIAYRFPKGHAVAYVSMAVRCAWFKVHRPLAYYATYFTLRCDGYDIQTRRKGLQASLNKRNDILGRLQRRENVPKPEQDTINALEQTIERYDRGYSFAPLHVNTSDALKFTPDEKHGKIIPSLTCIDGLGASVANQIVEARKKGGPFQSVEDLAIRGHVGEKLIETLRDLHALDGLPESDQRTLF